MNDSRLPFVLLIFIVIPTAVLSLLAARSLKQGELLEQRRQGVAARSAVRGVSAQVDDRLQGDLAVVMSAMTEALAEGGDVRRIGAGARRSEHARALVGQVYLFVNPWGFLWPENADTEVDGHDEILSGLRAGMAARRAAEQPIALNVGGAAYLFTPIGGRDVYLAGFRVDRSALTSLLAGALAEAALGQVRLGVEGAGIRIATDGSINPGAVLVEDSFGQRAEMLGVQIDSDRQALASVSLRAPLNGVVVSAYQVEGGGVMSTGRLQGNFHLWGILMLAGGIIGSAWLVMGRASAELRRARYRSEFIAGVSHDLRTPIASVRVMAESLYLDRVPDADRRRQFLGTIVNECERLSQLAERVLFLVRFGQNAITYNYAPTDCAAVTEEIVEAFRDRYACAAIDGHVPQVDTDIRQAGPVVLDTTAFRQVLVNLLDNAVKYGKEAAGSACRILVSVDVVDRRRGILARNRSYVCVSVRDWGQGISRADRRRIFRRYYRAPSAIDANVSGVGLGLAVCRHVAEGHGGWIDVEDAAGGGTVFRVYVPVTASVTVAGA